MVSGNIMDDPGEAREDDWHVGLGIPSYSGHLQHSSQYSLLRVVFRSCNGFSLNVGCKSDRPCFT